MHHTIQAMKKQQWFFKIKLLLVRWVYNNQHGKVIKYGIQKVMSIKNLSDAICVSELFCYKLNKMKKQQKNLFLHANHYNNFPVVL